MLISREIEPFA